jgi:hypothetical protein
VFAVSMNSSEHDGGSSVSPGLVRLEAALTSRVRSQRRVVDSCKCMIKRVRIGLCSTAVTGRVVRTRPPRTSQRTAWWDRGIVRPARSVGTAKCLQRSQ